MACDQQLQIGHVVVFDQHFLHKSVCIPGDEGVKIPIGAKGEQTLLVGGSAAQGRVEREGGRTQLHPGDLLHIDKLRPLCLETGQQQFQPSGGGVRPRDGHRVHRHALQQLGHSIDMVLIKMGEHQHVQVDESQGGKVVGRHVSGVVRPVPAAVHQTGVPAGQQGGG